MDFFKSIISSLRRLFSSLFDRVKPSAIIAVRIVDALKKIVESDAVLIILDLSPYGYTSRIVHNANRLLRLISAKLLKVQNIAENSDQEALESLVAHLRSLDAEGRKAFWVTIAAELTEALASEKLTFNQSVLISQVVFSELRKR